MPITQQGKKAMRRDAKRRVNNLRRSRAMKETTKDVLDLAALGKKKEAEGQLFSAYKAIDKAMKQGVIKKNTAARKKSRLAKAIAQ